MIRQLFTNNSAYINHSSITTDIGVLEGAFTSPILFNLYIDSLLRLLDSLGLQPLAFADDIAFIALGSMKLIKGIKAVEVWAIDNGICIKKKIWHNVPKS